MTQFNNPYADPYVDPSLVPPKTSGMAITALVFSLIVCCPITTLLGPILGLVAFVTIGSNPTRKGRGLAVAAIIIGAIATALWVVGSLYLYDKFKLMMEVAQRGPTMAMSAGSSGDTAGFKSKFFGAGASASDAEAVAFISEAEARYGKFISATFDERAQPGSPPMGQPSIVFPYDFKFEEQTVPAEVEIILMDEKTNQWVWKLGSIVLKDESAGNVSYPPGATASQSRGTRSAPPPGRSGSSTSGDSPTDADDGEADADEEGR